MVNVPLLQTQIRQIVEDANYSKVARMLIRINLLVILGKIHAISLLETQLNASLTLVKLKPKHQPAFLFHHLTYTHIRFVC